MNEQVGLGFTYDVTAFSPDGKETEHFNVHNLVPNEAITRFLKQVFIDPNWSSRFQISLMTNYYEPTVSDTFSIMYTINAPYALFADDNTYPTVKSIEFDLGSDLISCTSKDYISVWNGSTTVEEYPTFSFAAPKLITGVIMHGAYAQGYNYSNDTIFSAALFPSPIQMEKNGKLTIKAGFTLISA